ncbi:MAG: 5'-3' exonuclease H3TH domain-containing protein, partial [Solirubrobacteraceae bacterium]
PGGRALLLTGDRDLYGAVGERVAVIEQRRAGRAEGDGEVTEIGPAGVRERYGIDPALVPDFIALRGDPSDGLPGAPGVGAKTAAALLLQHGSLEGVLEAARAINGVSAQQAPGGRPGGVRRPPGVHGSPTASPGGPMRERVARAIDDNAALLRAFKDIATLQRIDVERPADCATDRAAAAAYAAKLGMTALAGRLSGASSSAP